MSYMSRLWMATSVALVNCHSDQGGLKLKSALKFIDRSILPDVAELRWCSAVLNSDLRGFLGGDQKKKKQADESIRQVMYFNCWAQG
ncbi:hypothetical protein ABFS83_08G109900 [Erythranthe nasuta]